jgi:insertion element IS1 protein InsB
VGGKKHQRWLWYAIDAATGCLLSFVFGRRQDEMSKKPLSNSKVFNIRAYHTGDCGGYSALITKEKYVIGKIQRL